MCEAHDSKDPKNDLNEDLLKAEAVLRSVAYISRTNVGLFWFASLQHFVFLSLTTRFSSSVCDFFQLLHFYPFRIILKTIIKDEIHFVYSCRLWHGNFSVCPWLHYLT